MASSNISVGHSWLWTFLASSHLGSKAKQLHLCCLNLKVVGPVVYTFLEPKYQRPFGPPCHATPANTAAPPAADPGTWKLLYLRFLWWARTQESLQRKPRKLLTTPIHDQQLCVSNGGQVLDTISHDYFRMVCLVSLPYQKSSLTQIPPST